MSDTTPATTDEATETGEEATPRDEYREDMLATLTDALGDAVVDSHIDPGRELWVRVTREAWRQTAEVAKARLGCSFFDFLSAIDWLPSPWGRYEDAELEATAPAFDQTSFETGYAGGDTRFQLFARVADVRRHHSVVLKADLPGVESESEGMTVDSLVPVYEGANWHERECWEMFGIVFDGHPNLRHLYLPAGFEGHPLRKDFPLLARVVKPWPGVVDVEPMPEGAAADDGGSSNGSGDDTSGGGDEGGDT